MKRTIISHFSNTSAASYAGDSEFAATGCYYWSDIYNCCALPRYSSDVGGGWV